MHSYTLNKQTIVMDSNKRIERTLSQNALCSRKRSACNSESAIVVSCVRSKRRCSWLLLPAAAAADDEEEDEDDDDESTNMDHA